MVTVTCMCRSSTLIIHKVGKIETLKVAHPLDSIKCYLPSFHCVVQTYIAPVCANIEQRPLWRTFMAYFAASAN